MQPFAEGMLHDRIRRRLKNWKLQIRRSMSRNNSSCSMLSSIGHMSGMSLSLLSAGSGTILSSASGTLSSASGTLSSASGTLSSASGTLSSASGTLSSDTSSILDSCSSRGAYGDRDGGPNGSENLPTASSSFSDGGSTGYISNESCRSSIQSCFNHDDDDDADEAGYGTPCCVKGNDLELALFNYNDRLGSDGSRNSCTSSSISTGGDAECSISTSSCNNVKIPTKDDHTAALHRVARRDFDVPLSGCCEMLENVTPGRLRGLTRLTLRARSADMTFTLCLRGDATLLDRRFFSKQAIRGIGKACPALKRLVTEELNLSTSSSTRGVCLKHFPATLTSLSVRNSVIDFKLFFRPSGRRDFGNIRVLDLGGTVNVPGDADCNWPRMENLDELYLEGARGLRASKFLRNVLENCPSLRTIDLEGTDVASGVMVTLADLAPQLERLFLGFTDVRDGELYALNRQSLQFRRLEVVCLADTVVTDVGLTQLRQAAPKLRDVTVNRCTVAESFGQDDRIFLPLRVRRLQNVHIGAVFRNQGCDHFRQQHPSMRVQSSPDSRRTSPPTRQRTWPTDSLDSIEIHVRNVHLG